MLNKKLMMLTILLVSLLAISAVSAEDNATEDIVSLDETTDDFVSESVINDNLEVIQEDTLSTTHTVSGNTFEDIQDVVNGANTGDTIILSGHYTGSGKEININKRVSIVGENNACLDAKFSSRIFSISQDNVTIKNLKIINGNSNVDGGGAIDVGYQYDDLKGFYYYHLYCFNCSFVNNHAEYGSGAIDASGEGSVVYDCTFVNNSATYSGAISMVDAFNCSFVNNKASSSGAMFGGDATICTFVNNSADESGALNSGRAIGCTFVNNSATKGDGGAILEPYGVVNCTFISNSATGVGGAIYCYEHENLNISNSKFLNNTANNGGAIWLNYYCSNANIINCSFENNNAENSISALYLQGSSSFVSDCTFVNNSRNDQFGIGVVELTGDYGILKNSTFSNMRDPLSFNSDYGEVYKCSFVNNSGVIVRWDALGKSSLHDCEFINNSAYELINVKKWIFSSVSEYNNFTVKNSIINNSYGGAVNMQNNLLTITNSVSKGNITVKISNETFIELANSSETQFDLNGLKSGTYNANIYFSGDDEFEASEMNIPITIESNYKLIASDVIKYYGGSQKCVVNLTAKNGPLSNVNVKFTLDGKTYNIKTDSKGQASVDLNLPVGTYDVVSEYEGVSTTSKVTVKSTLTTADATGTYLNSKVSATFLDTNGKVLASKQVTFKVGNKTYTATTNSKGVATADVDLCAGTYTVNAINPVNNEQKSAKLTISKANSTIKLTSSQKNGVVTLTATLTPDSASGSIIFSGIGSNQTSKIVNGKATLTLNNLEAGDYAISANYNGDKNLNAAKQVSTTFKVKENPVLTVKDLTKVYGNAQNLKISLKDKNGNAISNKKVNVVVGTVSKPLTTNSNGQASLAITLAPSSYVATVTFAGDSEFNKATATSKVIVKKAAPKLTAKAKTFKKSIKTKKYTVTLKNNKNKALKKVKLSLKVKGKTYYATTNKYGKATFKITKLTKKGKYTATLKFKGSKYYKAKTVKPKITIK